MSITSFFLKYFPYLGICSVASSEASFSRESVSILTLVAVPVILRMEKALYKKTHPVKLPCLLHPAAPITLFPILTLHKILTQKNINFFSLFHWLVGEGKKINKYEVTFKKGYN